MERIAPQDVRRVVSRHMLVDGFRLVVDLDRSHGSWLVDQATGEKYLDFYTFFASNPLGFNHPRLRDPAFLDRHQSAKDQRTTTGGWEEVHRVTLQPDLLERRRRMLGLTGAGNKTPRPHGGQLALPLGLLRVHVLQQEGLPSREVLVEALVRWRGAEHGQIHVVGQPGVAVLAPARIIAAGQLLPF